MDIVEFEGCNFTFTAPEGAENIGGLRCFFNGVSTVFAVKLSDDERADFERTGLIYVSIMSGRSFAPIYLGSARGAWEVTARGGEVWTEEHKLTPQAYKHPDIEPFIDDMLLVYRGLLGPDTLERDLPLLVSIAVGKFKGLANPSVIIEMIEDKIKEIANVKTN